MLRYERNFCTSGVFMVLGQSGAKSSLPVRMYGRTVLGATLG